MSKASSRKPGRGQTGRRQVAAGRRRASGSRKRTPSAVPAPKPSPPTDIRTCAALLELSAVMLGREGWFVLAGASRSDGSPFVWRQANDAERAILEPAAGDRIVAGHWSIRPGGHRSVTPRKRGVRTPGVAQASDMREDR